LFFRFIIFYFYLLFFLFIFILCFGIRVGYLPHKSAACSLQLQACRMSFLASAGCGWKYVSLASRLRGVRFMTSGCGCKMSHLPCGKQFMKRCQNEDLPTWSLHWIYLRHSTRSDKTNISSVSVAPAQGWCTTYREFSTMGKRTVTFIVGMRQRRSHRLARPLRKDDTHNTHS